MEGVVLVNLPAGWVRFCPRGLLCIVDLMSQRCDRNAISPQNPCSNFTIVIQETYRDIQKDKTQMHFLEITVVMC